MSLEKDLAYLTGPECAGRLSGTDGARKAARYLADRLAEMGYRVLEQPVEVPAARLTGPVRLSVSGVGLRHRLDFGEAAALSRGGRFAGPLVVLSDGEAVDPASLAGRVVLIPQRPEGFDLGATVSTAAELGVAALLVEHGEPGWFHKTVFGSSGARLPVFRVRASVARSLADRAGALVEGDLPLEVGARDCRNVVGLPSGAAPRPLLMLTAHYDHVGDDPEGHRFPGARDNASGVVAVLEAARRLAGTWAGVAFLTGEESGLWGARRLAAAPPAPIWAVINLDEAGGEPTLAAVRVGHAGPGDPLADLAARKLSAGGSRVAWVAGSDDSAAFIAAGIPTAGLGQQPTRPYAAGAHSPDDMPDLLHLPAVSEAAERVVHIATGLLRGGDTL